jgi:hypothetical protein
MTDIQTFCFSADGPHTFELISTQVSHVKVRRIECMKCHSPYYGQSSKVHCHVYSDGICTAPVMDSNGMILYICNSVSDKNNMFTQME